MLNSANHERDRFLPVTAGAHLGGINAATMGLTGSASDYMRLAMPVRDPDNGDNSISGSGKYFYSSININCSCMSEWVGLGTSKNETFPKV